MLTALFFLSVFSSLVWLVYSGLFVHARFATVDMSSIDAYTLALYAGLVVIPVWIIWQVFGFINQYFRTKSTDTKLGQLFTQMKKNQDYTDLVVRVMLDAEHEIKDGFVVGKFDVFVADMNEILADIVQRSNAASSIQLEQLWLRVKNGERWSIAKTFIENAKSHQDFDVYLREKAQKDSVFKGTLVEFCARYQNLTDLLEKHDRDRVFITILETGVMGKVYSILAPIANDVIEPVPQIIEEPEEDTIDISPEIVQMEAPKVESKPKSVFSKLNPFSLKKKNKKIEAEINDEPEKVEEDDDEAFFSALQKSMTENEDEKSEPRLQAMRQEDEDLPHFEMPKVETKELNQEMVEEQIQDSLDSFLEEPSLDNDENEKEDQKKTDEENMAYPFGGWTDEN